MFVSLVVAAVGSLGAPLITAVAGTFRVNLVAAQWTMTVASLTGAVATPFLGRLGAGPHRRPTILATLCVVVAGSALTVLPLSFGWLMLGRGAQGVGMALTPLMMGVARDHLRPPRTSHTIALLSVTATAGSGVGFPLAGLLAEIGGVRAAYGAGLVLTMLALVVAWRFVPAAPAGRSGRLDVPGAVLLGLGLIALLLVISEANLWRQHLATAVALSVIAVVLFGVWVLFERRCAAPLVDVRLLRHPAVAGANVAMLVAGAGMFLFLTLVTRYAQTPREAGYGLAMSTFAAGLVLVPFAAIGVVAGKFTPRVSGRFGARAVLAVSAAGVLAGFVVFAFGRPFLVLLLIAMGLLGFGVGGFNAAMPAMILSVTRMSETSSAMSVNGVVRSVGFAAGSAISGLILQAATSPGSEYPRDGGYLLAAWIGVAAMALTVVISLLVKHDNRAVDESGVSASFTPYTGD